MKKFMPFGVLVTILFLGSSALAQQEEVGFEHVRFAFSGQGDKIHALVANNRTVAMTNLEIRAFFEVSQGPIPQSSSQRFSLDPGGRLEVQLPLPQYLSYATVMRLRLMQGMATVAERTFTPNEFRRPGALTGPKSSQTPASPSKNTMKPIDVPETITPITAPKTMNPQPVPQ
jgi:hypothetical protein